MNQTRQINRYLKQTKRLIPSECIGKKQVLETIRKRINHYFSDHPAASMDEFMQEFGTPEELAESFLDEMSGAELVTDLNRRRRRILCTGGCLIAVAVLLAAYATVIERNIAFGIIETITPYEKSDEDMVQTEFNVQTLMRTKNQTAL